MLDSCLLFPHGILKTGDVMIDYLEDNRRRLRRVMVEIDDDCLHWLPDPGANSIAVTGVAHEPPL
jgi:hypothetical protein